MEAGEHGSNRRQFLATGALCGVAGVAGCSSLLGDGDDLNVEGTAIPDPTEPERSEYGQENFSEFFATVKNQGAAGEIGYAVSYSTVQFGGSWSGVPGDPAFEEFGAGEQKEVRLTSSAPPTVTDEGPSQLTYFAIRVWAAGITPTVSNNTGEARFAEVVLLDDGTEVTSTTEEIGADETADVELRREEIPEDSPGELSVEVSAA